MAFRLLYKGVSMPLNGVAFVGRSLSCTFVLDDKDVSRRHAKLTVGETVVVEDLGSINGVFVNGTRVEGQSTLKPGDELSIGSHSFTLEGSQPQRTARSLNNEPTGKFRVDYLFDDDTSDDDIPATDPKDRLSIFGAMIERYIADGNVDGAEDTVSGLLLDRLAESERGRIERAELDAALSVATQLARAGRVRWRRYILEICAACRQVPSDEAVALLEAATLNDDELRLLNAYVHRLEGRTAELDRARRGANARLLALANSPP